MRCSRVSSALCAIIPQAPCGESRRCSHCVAELVCWGQVMMERAALREITRQTLAGFCSAWRENHAIELALYAPHESPMNDRASPAVMAALKETLEAQIAADDPPETRLALARLLRAGIPEDEAWRWLSAALLQEMALIVSDNARLIAKDMLQR